MDPTTNWNNWLAGQSYLETDYRNEGNPTSSARGYFQFIDGTAKRATEAGLPDPRAGGYPDQAAATQAYIRHFHPDAASAIDQGDFGTATHLLRSEWPSLPGGSQQQNPGRYSTWSQILGGQGPRPDQTASSSPPTLPAVASAQVSPAEPAPQPAAAPGYEPQPEPEQQNLQSSPPLQPMLPPAAVRLRNVLARLYGIPQTQTLPGSISQRLIDAIGRPS